MLNELKKNPSLLSGVGKLTTEEGKEYYNIVGVMDYVGGKTNFDGKTTTISLSYKGKTAWIVYSMDIVPTVPIYLFPFGPEIARVPINNALLGFSGYYTQGNAQAKVTAGFLPLVYNKKNFYANLDELLAYFMKIWCDTSIENSDQSTLAKATIGNKKMSLEGKKALVIIEIANAFSKEKGYLTIVDGNLEGINPHNVGDGSITVGFGDYLDANDYKYC